MADADPHRAPEPEPLAIDHVLRSDDLDSVLLFGFNRAPTREEMEAMAALPPSPQIHAEARHFAERVILAELGVRLFRMLFLGGIVVPESPAACDWLKGWIDGGVNHSPMGAGPMLWPEHLPFIAGVLRQWGFQPTPTMPAYVARQPALQGVPTRKRS